MLPPPPPDEYASSRTFQALFFRETDLHEPYKSVTMCVIDLGLHRVIEIKTAKRKGGLVFPGARHLRKKCPKSARPLASPK
jgi:hypothetical protein